MAKSEMMRQVPPGYKEAWIEFAVTNVGATMVATQLTNAIMGMPVATAYIMKDIEVMFSGTALYDAYLKINTVATDTPATKIGGRYYQDLSAIHWDGDSNGPIGGDLTAAPYLQLCAGVGSAEQTVYCTAHLYYKV